MTKVIFKILKLFFRITFFYLFRKWLPTSVATTNCKQLLFTTYSDIGYR